VAVTLSQEADVWQDVSRNVLLAQGQWPTESKTEKI